LLIDIREGLVSQAFPFWLFADAMTVRLLASRLRIAASRVPVEPATPESVASRYVLSVTTALLLGPGLLGLKIQLRPSMMFWVV